MDKLKQWVALTVVGCLAIMAAGWFLLVAPKRSEAADLQMQAADRVSANDQLETELQVLQAKAADLPKEQAKLAAVSAKLPDDPALPGLIRALLEAGKSSGIDLVSVAPGVPELVVPAVVAAPVAPVEGQPATAEGQPPVPAPAPAQGQTTPDPAATPAAPAAPGVVAPGPAGQLASIPLAISVVGDYFEVQQFVAALEQLPRALRVQTLNLAPGTSPSASESATASVEEGRSLTTTINGFVYMAANRPTATAVNVPGDATAAPAAPDTTAPPAG